jgi:hypothetical protein
VIGTSRTFRQAQGPLFADPKFSMLLRLSDHPFLRNPGTVRELHFCATVLLPEQAYIALDFAAVLFDGLAFRIHSSSAPEAATIFPDFRRFLRWTLRLFLQNQFGERQARNISVTFTERNPILRFISF